MHRLVFAIVAPWGCAAIVVWALYGPTGLEVFSGLTASLALSALRAHRLLRRARNWLARHRPVKPEDRERRRVERAQQRRRREELRRVRAGAMRRYGAAIGDAMATRPRDRH